MARKRPSRDQLKPGEVLCQYCTAKCCRYFALQVDTPTTWDDFDKMRWYVMHGRTAIFVDSDVWYLLVYADCQNLQADHRCGLYETRPQICRDYTTDNCEYDDDGVYDKFFEVPEQLWEYAEAILPQRSRPKWQPASPALPKLPILTV
jgi:Fe-S-cluster containining protein